ncbi:hypothetical protein QFC22_000444 [Naganishia vaughanmartiniae]|uniref:Uncharacterized protein n=1 Tax=Naganishia vaughanmartiniae TaxID=1424756 RepID=A0ACC2XNB7_9TREE|nr:hypothetical protein QFC22_000444 [Naganishia vaughanmartiniae]
MPQLVLSPVDEPNQQSPETGYFPFVLGDSNGASSVASIASGSTLRNGQLLIASLTTFSKYFHPVHGLYRDHSEIDFDLVPDDGLPTISPDEVEWLIIDLRFVVADNEWTEVDQQISPRFQTRTLPDLDTSSDPISSKSTIFTNCYKLSLIGAEYVEATLNDARAKALVELVFDRLDPRSIMEVEWLTAEDQVASALTLNSHLVHPAIIEAGKCWSKGPEVNPLAARYSNGEDEDMSSPIGIRGEDIGLRCLRIQGGFPMPNPVSDSSTPYALKPDYSFAFKDWIKGGVECLIWSFKGEYSVTCTLGILRHLLKYLAEYFATLDSSLPCALLLLQDLNPTVVRQLQTEDTTAMRRCGADNLDPELKIALSDVVFIESDTTEAGAQIIERLWDDGTAVDEDCGRTRALRRLKADIAANDRAYRRLESKANTTTVNPAPKLFTLGPPSHTKVRDSAVSPATPMFLCSPASSRSQSYVGLYGSTHPHQSSNSASTASLNTLDDVSNASAIPRIRPAGVYEHDDSPPKSSEMRTKPLPPTEEPQSRHHGLL